MTTGRGVAKPEPPELADPCAKYSSRLELECTRRGGEGRLGAYRSV